MVYQKSEFLAEDVIAEEEDEEEEEEEEEEEDEDAPDINPTDNPGKTWKRKSFKFHLQNFFLKI